MPSKRPTLALGLTLWAVLAPVLLPACSTTSIRDRRILQYLNQEGFGKRYQGNAQEQNYVAIGDTITYADSYNLDLVGNEIVDVDGTIVIPQAGSVFVAGMTRDELESYLTQKLSPYYVETDIKVRMRTGGSKVYFVLGEVVNPGAKPYFGDTTVMEAVIDAVPREWTANLGRVEVIRADPRNPLVIPVDVAAMWDSGDSTYNLQIREFDIVYVPPTFLKQVGNLISGILVPFLEPFRIVIQTIFFYPGARGGRRGGGSDFWWQ